MNRLIEASIIAGRGKSIVSSLETLEPRIVFLRIPLFHRVPLSSLSLFPTASILFLASASESFDSSFFEEGSTRRRISINFRSEISVSLGDGFLRGDLSWKYSQGLSSFFPNRIERGESLNPVNFPPIFPILFPEYRVSS